MKLPTWVILALREMVRDANAKRAPGKRRWTVSSLLEAWLLDALSKEIPTLDLIGKRSPEFRRAVEQWIREVARTLCR